MATTNLDGFGHVESVELDASTLTLSLTAHSGKVVNVMQTAVLTLPAVGTAHRYAVRVGAEGITVTISPNANDLIAGAGAANAGVGADNKDVIFTNQPAGSYIVLEYADATGWTIVRALGTFTFEG
jgi:hypothetical protein